MIFLQIAKISYNKLNSGKYKHLIKLLGGVPKFIDTYPEFTLSPSKIEEQITKKTTAIIINSPNNPTGAAYTEDELIKAAKEYLIPVPSNPPFIVKGDGVNVEDLNGKQYLDFTSGPGVMSVGHCHPELVEEAMTQFRTLTQCPGNLLNIPYIELAKKLAEISPGDLKMSFFCNSGAEAVDGAVKLAIRHAVRQGKSALGVVALEHGFHGRLSLALSLTGMTSRKKGLSTYASFPGARHIMAPYCYRCPLSYPACEIYCADCLENLFQTQMAADGIAAFICEPLLGVGGAIVPPKEYLPRIEEICKKYEVVLIFDEIFAGFGRTGKMFASEHYGVVP